MQRPGSALAAPLADPHFWATDPNERQSLLGRLRHEAPVAWCNEPGFWAASRYAEVVEASTDPASFCSSKGVLLQDIGAELPEVPGALLYVDPPDHTRYRKLVQPGFTPARVRDMERIMRTRASALFDQITPGEVTEVVQSLTSLFPIQVIADLLGIPDADGPRVRAWSDAFIAAADGGREQSEEVLALTTEAVTYLLDEVGARRSRGGEDLVSHLATVEVDGEKLTDGELTMFLVQLLVAGNETTRNLLTGGLIALAEHTSEWERLASGPSLLPGAIHEMLRWTSPVISFLRTATRDLHLGSQPIAEGEAVLLLYESANRDPAEFGPTADQFDIGRNPNHHLAFGFGAHYCLGAKLAVSEARIFFEELISRFRSLEIAGEARRVPSTVIAGIAEAPMVLS